MTNAYHVVLYYSKSPFRNNFTYGGRKQPRLEQKLSGEWKAHDLRNLIYHTIIHLYWVNPNGGTPMSKGRRCSSSCLRAQIKDKALWMKSHMIILRCQGIFKGCPKEIVIKMQLCPFLSGIFWRPNKAGAMSRLISLKFSDEHPWAFHMGSLPCWVPAPPPPPQPLGENNTIS